MLLITGVPDIALSTCLRGVPSHSSQKKPQVDWSPLQVWETLRSPSSPLGVWTGYRCFGDDDSFFFFFFLFFIHNSRFDFRSSQIPPTRFSRVYATPPLTPCLSWTGVTTSSEDSTSLAAGGCWQSLAVEMEESSPFPEISFPHFFSLPLSYFPRVYLFFVFQVEFSRKRQAGKNKTRALEHVRHNWVTRSLGGHFKDGRDVIDRFYGVCLIIYFFFFPVFDPLCYLLLFSFGSSRFGHSKAHAGMKRKIGLGCLAPDKSETL